MGRSPCAAERHKRRWQRPPAKGLPPPGKSFHARFLATGRLAVVKHAIASTGILCHPGEDQSYPITKRPSDAAPSECPLRGAEQKGAQSETQQTLGPYPAGPWTCPPMTNLHAIVARWHVIVHIDLHPYLYIPLCIYVVHFSHTHTLTFFVCLHTAPHSTIPY